jgi:hypothetical protein
MIFLATLTKYGNDDTSVMVTRVFYDKENAYKEILGLEYTTNMNNLMTKYPDKLDTPECKNYTLAHQVLTDEIKDIALKFDDEFVTFWNSLRDKAMGNNLPIFYGSVTDLKIE